MSDLPITVRVLTRDDMPAMKAIIEANKLFPSEMLDAMAAPFFEGVTTDLWFAVGTPATGFAYAAQERMTDESWNQLLIAVDPAEQGKGIGKALMRHLETVISARGAHLLIVETSGLAEFEATRGFYRNIGFEEEAHIRDFYQRGEDKIVFRRLLLATAP